MSLSTLLSWWSVPAPATGAGLGTDLDGCSGLGCSECYKVFAEGLESLLKTMHKGTKHVGKVPQVFRQTQDLADKLKSLQTTLEKAIANEDFETAATLRDDVKALKAQMTELSVK